MRARPRQPEARPFARFSRPKWWHEAKARARSRIADNSTVFGIVSFNALIAMELDGKGLTDDECLVFGIERGGWSKNMLRALSSPMPFWDSIPKVRA